MRNENKYKQINLLFTRNYYKVFNIDEINE